MFLLKAESFFSGFLICNKNSGPKYFIIRISNFQWIVCTSNLNSGNTFRSSIIEFHPLFKSIFKIIMLEQFFIFKKNDKFTLEQKKKYIPCNISL